MQRAALEFVEKVESLMTADAVMNEFGAALRKRGVENYLFTFNPLPTETFADITLASRLPAGLTDAYNALGLVRHDPSFRHAQQTALPFRWFKEAPYNPEAEPRAQEVIEFLRDFGLVDGIVLPFTTTARRLGHVWFGGPTLDVPKREEPVLHCMCFYAFERVLQIKGVETSAPVALTSREREVLTRIAIGEKTEQIADAIKLSRSTVLHHLNNCRRKLGAATLAHAVMIAVRMRMI
ncbi:LuxR family transcriptional regulator [Bradyrhizobium sp. BRP23]|uniref:helix-turn-helix transcriptional regulator n=1 Tax=Bradyrhizobium sp. BRP23 TaxID=2793820 RepID=UPI001CD6071F|nr:LuxR family transcriptional regulator [Bradyrhizobium sp. BRP23]MCA1419509.1 autoinducer binding domain-containing protein [Bradyrhizobium sp. BRP23]